MPSFCAVMNCGMRGNRDNVRFFRIPAALKNAGDQANALSKHRQEMWIKAIKRGPLSDSQIKYGRVCSRHFKTGAPAELLDKDHPDWIPNQNMGYVSSDSVGDTQINRSQRATKRRKQLDEFVSKVASCEKVDLAEVIDGKKIKVEGYEVILEDTILFPEGGGQPCDHGFLNDIPVFKIIRKADKAIHITKQPLHVGEEVKQKIIWERRFDHMQQHSGQHLITALIDREYKFPTVSWWLGEEVSYIELDTPQITQDQIRDAEDKINDLIRQGKKVTVDVFTEDTPEEQLKEVRARGLPEDHKGDIRVIKIEDVEGNMCCGTHVTNLSQLQVIKLLHSEKSKRKDKTLLYFLVGNRVLKRLTGCIEREQQLMVLLKSNPSQHAELVDKLQKNVKTLTKNIQSVLKDLATLEASKLNDMLPVPAYFSMHKKEAEPDFMNIFIRELGERKDILLFLSTGDEKQVGNIVLYGPEKAVADLGPKICELLDGKGAGKGNKFQAKVSKMANRIKAEDLIAEYFK